MEISEEKTKSERYEPNLKKIAEDILDVLSDSIALAASPSTLWLLVLYNCNGGRGFNGYVTNPQFEQAAQAPYASEVYKGITITYDPTTQNYSASYQGSSWVFKSIDLVKMAIDDLLSGSGQGGVG